MSEKVFIQVLCEVEVRDMAKKIAKVKDTDMSKYLRDRIRGDYKRMVAQGLIA
jgi:hypothetical protein